MKITDPDNLTYELNTVAAGTANVVIDTAAKRIELNKAALLTDDGVTCQALYSKLKEVWKAEPLAIPYDFPMEAVTPEQFEFIKDWELAGVTSVNLIRDAGFAYRNSAGTSLEEYMGFDSVFALNNNAQVAGDQVYIELNQPNGTVQNTYITGQANEPIMIYSDAARSNVDYRNNDIRFFVREYQKKFGSSSVSALNVPLPLTYKKYAFPISNSSDSIKITHDDTAVSTTAPYTSMSIDVFGVAQTRSIGGVTYNFDIIINAANGTAEEVYEFVQYQLRQAGDIDTDNSHPLNGATADAMLEFIGDTLRTLQDRNGRGIYIDNFNANDTNRLEFTDNTGTIRTFPFVAAGSINFNANLVNDAAAKYWVYFTTNPAGNFGTDNAVLVHANDSVASVAGGDITFTAPSTIASTPLDLSIFGVGEVIHVEGSTSNDGYYEVATSSANTLTLVEATITTEAGLAATNITQTITGNVSGASSISFDFDYQSNTQGGRTANTDAGVTVVAIGLATGQYVQTTATIAKAVGQNISLVSTLERNYSNPV